MCILSLHLYFLSVKIIFNNSFITIILLLLLLNLYFVNDNFNNVIFIDYYFYNMLIERHITISRIREVLGLR